MQLFSDREGFSFRWQIVSDVFQLGGDFYVQLLLDSNGRKEAEDRFRTKFPMLPVITFYQHESCLTFLRSMVKDKVSIGNAILIIQSDETSINDVLTEFEQIDSIKHIYVCSKYASTNARRRIVHGTFPNEHDLFVRLIVDHMNDSVEKMHEQIENHTDPDLAKQYLQSAESFHWLLKENQRISPPLK